MDDLEAILCYVTIQTQGWPYCRLMPLVSDLNAAAELPGAIEWDGDYAIAGQPFFDVLKEYGLLSDISTEGSRSR